MRPAIMKTLAAAALAVVLPSASAAAEVEEEFHYRWRLGGFKGFLARLVLPGSGDAVLRTTELAPGVYRNELHITSPASRRGEFWRYGSEVEGADCGRVIRAWTEQLFRGRGREHHAELEEQGVLDIPSCICRLRHDPPERAVATRIWSEGRVYPIRISSPVAGERRAGERPVATHTYTVSGVERPDERFWKGRLILVVALDEERTPLEIGLAQPGLSVRLELAAEP